MAQRKQQASPGWSQGWEHGYRTGLPLGYHLGLCDAVRQQVPAPAPARRDVKLMYVTSGKGFPYSPLDQSVIETLRGLVRELLVLSPNDNLVMAAMQHRPDLVLVLEGLACPVEKIDAIREMGIRTAIWFTDDPYYTDATASLASHYDVIFTLELECVPFYLGCGCRQVHYLPFAANPAIYRPKPVPVNYRYDISFIGSAYWTRVDFFDRIASFLAERHTYISGIWWDRLRHYKQLAPKIELGKWMGAEETASYYYGSKIVINLHRSTNDPTYNKNTQGIGAVSPNPRTFEIASCGTLQMTDVRSDLGRFYVPGKEIVTYSSPEELMQKIDYYLAHEEERTAIALNALRRTLQEHTYVHRLDRMLGILFG